eukprot:NODE_137_length_16306_cov_0.462640.p6 type:complete len:297 gc:universal NODE_137_length_16306_cov_0.462640:5531-4641(-)
MLRKRQEPEKSTVKISTFPSVLPNDMLKTIAINSIFKNVNEQISFYYAKSLYDFTKCSIIHPNYVQKVRDAIQESSVCINLKTTDLIKGDDFECPNLANFFSTIEAEKQKQTRYTSFDRCSNLVQFMTQFQEKLKNYNFLGKTDISAFYNSIYIHAISWLAWVKKASKELNNPKAWPNKLEALYRSCIYKEPVSLPIGQEIFSELAEFILLCLDIHIKSKMNSLLDKIEVIRFDEAFYFFGPTKDDVNGGLMLTMQSVEDFKFSLNASKTGIREIPHKRPDLLHLHEIDIELSTIY